MTPDDFRPGRFSPEAQEFAQRLFGPAEEKARNERWKNQGVEDPSKRDSLIILGITGVTVAAYLAAKKLGLLPEKAIISTPPAPKAPLASPTPETSKVIPISPQEFERITGLKIPPLHLCQGSIYDKDTAYSGCGPVSVIGWAHAKGLFDANDIDSVTHFLQSTREKKLWGPNGGSNQITIPEMMRVISNGAYSPTTIEFPEKLEIFAKDYPPGVTFEQLIPRVPTQMKTTLEQRLNLVLGILRNNSPIIIAYEYDETETGRPLQHASMLLGISKPLEGESIAKLTSLDKWQRPSTKEEVLSFGMKAFRQSEFTILEAIHSFDPSFVCSETIAPYLSVFGYPLEVAEFTELRKAGFIFY